MIDMNESIDLSLRRIDLHRIMVLIGKEQIYLKRYIDSNDNYSGEHDEILDEYSKLYSKLTRKFVL